MGLACPVCEVPHPDGEHLADHVAITAATRGGDHRTWLDEHAPDWESMGRTELAALVADHAEEVDSIDLHEEVADHGRERIRALAADRQTADIPDDLDEEARATLAEARALTERMLGDGDDEE